MAGIYLHIPFCRQACTYCGFYFTTRQSKRPAFVAALQTEIRLRATELAGWPVTSIYLGGGTPSLLTSPELEAILSSLHAHASLSPGAEVTLEANPDDLSPAKLRELRALGITRLSLGLQALQADELRWMNRAHSAADGLRALAWVQQAGFPSFSVDLIYGTPGLQDHAWAATLDRLLALPVPHLSAYALSLEPKTRLERAVATGRQPPPPEDAAARQQGMLWERLTSAGYDAYELANFARPGHQSRHNWLYWTQQPCLGLGPAAHSYDGQACRRRNLPSLTGYLQALGNKRLPPAELDPLSSLDRYNECVLTRLRLAEGLPLALLEAEYPAYWQLSRPAASDLCRRGLVAMDAHRLRLTAAGRLLADAVTVELMVSDA